MTSTTLQPQTQSTIPAAPRHRRFTGRAARRLAPFGAAIAIIAALAGGTASSASAGTSDPGPGTRTGCRTVAYQYGKLGYTVINRIYFCWDGSKVFNISTSKAHAESFTWNFINYDGSFEQQSNNTYYKKYVRGNFKNCVQWCFDSGVAWMTITVNRVGGAYIEYGAS